MRLYPVVVFCLVSILLLGSAGATWGARIQDGDPSTIGAALAQPDGATVTLTGEQVIRRGASGKSFAIKEFFERMPAKPRVLVISRRPLAVSEGWNVDVTGVLRTLSGVARDGAAVSQRVLVVSPNSVSVACDANGRPVLFLPVKDWATKRSLAAISDVSVMDEGGLPPVPDDPNSSPTPPAAGSRDSLKWLPDGAPVSIGGLW